MLAILIYIYTLTLSPSSSALFLPQEADFWTITCLPGPLQLQVEFCQWEALARDRREETEVSLSPLADHSSGSDYLPSQLPLPARSSSSTALALTRLWCTVTSLLVPSGTER